MKILARIKLFLYRPRIIAVSGSMEKSFVKEAIGKELHKEGFSVRCALQGFNTDIGLPLSILGVESGYERYKEWIPVMKKAFFSLFKRENVSFLVLEYGSSDPGDMRYLLSIVKPEVAVITNITQRYLESFSDMDHLVKEYEKIAVNTSRLLILNGDNERTRELVDYGSSRKVLVGFGNNCDIRIVESLRTEKGEKVNLKRKGKLDIRNTERFGKHHIYALLSAIAVTDYLKERD